VGTLVSTRLVALDIDGTIVHPAGSLAWCDSDGRLPTARIQQAIRGLEDAGIAVVLASGRMFPGTRLVHECLNLSSPLVCQQGCSVHAPSGEVLHEVQLDLDVAHEVVAYAKQLGHPYEWFTPLRYFASERNDASDGYAVVSGIQAEYMAMPELCGLPPTGAGNISTLAAAPNIHNELAARFGDAVHVLDFPGVTVCVSAHATTGPAMEMICADLGIDRSETIAIGDSVNDAPMLAFAGRGYALAHGDKYALSAADEVLDLAEHDAVAELLERVAAGPRPR
jgi:HAD superfamily hydrolase (TIGR01484 family)